jgi:hypothetical protein
MAIVAVLLTLTGGIVQKNIAQQERIVELEKVSQLFKQLSYQSYYGKGPINVRLQENKILITEHSKQNNGLEVEQYTSRELLFNQLVFVAQDYVISSKGIVLPSSFAIIFKNDIRHFPFKAMFDEITQ